MPNLPSRDLPPPFRPDVPVEVFEQIENAKRTMNTARSIFDKAEEKPIVAQLMGEFLADPTTPNEVKMEAFAQTLNLINNEEEPDQNRQIGETLIDMIRLQNDPGVRIRLAAILSSSLQKGSRENNKSEETKDVMWTRRAAFQSLANSDSSSRIYKNWAHRLLKPGQVLSVFNGIYDLGADLVMTPKITETIIEETKDPEPTSVAPDRELTFTGNIVQLNRVFPSPEKVALYLAQTGKLPGVFIVRSAGKRLVSVELPSAIVGQAHALLKQFREGQLTRDEVFDQIQPLVDDFLPRLNDEQRQAFLDPEANLHIRFGTERSAQGIRLMPNSSQVPLPPPDEVTASQPQSQAA